jgi:hypothetical protein
MKRHRVLVAVTALATAGTLGLSACGSSSSAGAKSGASSTPSSGSSGSGVSAASVKTFLAYTGGTAGKATGTPIDMGFINAQGGAYSYPEYSTELASLVSVINNQLGGADGHPLVVKSCFITTGEAQGQACAQQFLADKSMALIIQGPLEVGGTSFHATLAGKIPVVSALPNEITDATAKNAFYLGGGVLGSLGFVAYATKYLHAKTASILVPAGVPAGQQSAAQLKAAFGKLGVKVTEGTYAPTATDYLSAIEASGAKNADVFIPLVITPNQCLAVAKDLQQVPIKATVLSFDACLGSAVKSGLGDFPKWTYLSVTTNVNAPTTDPTTEADIAAYNDWDKTIDAQIPDANSAVVTVMTTLTALKMLNEAGADPTPASVTAQLAKFTGPLFLGAPTLTFGRPPFTAVGTMSSSFNAYEGNGKWKNLTGGAYVVPPAGGPPKGATGGPPGSAPTGGPPAG